MYGYSTISEPQPPDPEHPRKVLVIENGEAAIVVRIFTWYAIDRISVREILRRLEAEGAPEPSAATDRRCTPGWAHSSIIAMIDNEAYAGRFTWNRRKWQTDPRSGKRTSTERPRSEWIVRDVPELAIVTRDLWDAAQARRAESKRRFPGFGKGPTGEGGRHAGGAPARHLFSGALICASCGSKMQILGGKGD